jgi:excisionase family DNA binding protein
MESVISKYLSPKETAKYLGVSVELLQKWRSNGVGIPFMKLGESTSSLIRYDIDELNKYLQTKKIKTL